MTHVASWLTLCSFSILFRSLKIKYGGVFSMKFGSYKFVMASTPEAVREMLLKKSVEFAGRPQTYSIVTRTLGRYYMFYQYNRTYPEFIHKLLVILLVRGSLILFGKTFFAQCTIGRNTMYVSNWGRNRHFTWPCHLSHSKV